MHDTGQRAVILGEYILETGDSVKIPAYLKHKWVNQFEKNAIVLFSVLSYFCAI